MIKKILCFFCALCLVVPYCRTRALSVSAQAYVLYCPSTSEVVASGNATKRMSMASTTKIMTGLLLCESGDLDKTVAIKKEMVMVEGTSAGLRAGDVISRKDLLYGLMLESGNDAANVIAYEIGGNKENFAKLMNQKAAQIGMKNTNFITPSGLDDEAHYTTAYDMALLAAYAMQNEDFKQAVGSKNYTAVYNDGNSTVTYYNHNRLLRSLDGCEGIKTGFTKKSGRCLVTSCMRDGLRLIAVTLNAPDDWNDHKQLYTYGFDCYQKTELTYTLQSTISVAGGEKQELAITADAVEVYLNQGNTKNISYQIFLPSFVFAPVKKGDVLGQIVFKYGDQIVATAAIQSTEDCASVKMIEKNYWDLLLEKLLLLLSL